MIKYSYSKNLLSNHNESAKINFTDLIDKFYGESFSDIELFLDRIEENFFSEPELFNISAMFLYLLENSFKIGKIDSSIDFNLISKYYSLVLSVYNRKGMSTKSSEHCKSIIDYLINIHSYCESNKLLHEISDNSKMMFNIQFSQLCFTDNPRYNIAMEIFNQGYFTSYKIDYLKNRCPKYFLFIRNLIAVNLIFLDDYFEAENIFLENLTFLLKYSSNPEYAIHLQRQYIYLANYYFDIKDFEKSSEMIKMADNYNLRNPFLINVKLKLSYYYDNFSYNFGNNIFDFFTEDSHPWIAIAFWVLMINKKNNTRSFAANEGFRLLAAKESKSPVINFIRYCIMRAYCLNKLPNSDDIKKHCNKIKLSEEYEKYLGNDDLDNYETYLNALRFNYI